MRERVRVLSFVLWGVGVLFSTGGRASDFEIQQKWDDSAHRIRERVNDALREERCIHTYTHEIPELERNVSELQSERDEVLAELKSARFCQGCSRTARELQKEGIRDVQQHFDSNGGTRPAKPEEIRAKENHYAGLIDPRVQRLEKGRSALTSCEQNRFYWSREIGEIAADHLIPSATQLIASFTQAWIDRDQDWVQQILSLQQSVRVAHRNLEAARAGGPESVSRIKSATIIWNTVVRQLDDLLARYQESWEGAQKSFSSRVENLEEVHRELLREVARLDDQFLFGGSTLANGTYFAFPFYQELKRPLPVHELLDLDVYLILIQWRGRPL